MDEQDYYRGRVTRATRAQEAYAAERGPDDASVTRDEAPA
jgi:hypothetical protein